ncbi:MAG: glycosyltransferase family 4 protein [Pseudomonadales bacterium]|nr:glycosyltransferase family 4 protein [Pseudomonadales bacterium]
MTGSALKIIQILPALNAGGVERGTIEFARELVKQGHQSIVISNGGALVSRLEAEGSIHIQRPVHAKSLKSLLRVRMLRRLILKIQPDIIHVRSRIPAWMTWLAWRNMPESTRPGLVSTFHGLYSVTPYSAIMGKAERVIAISDCVHDYIIENYSVEPSIITRIYRGLDSQAFSNQELDEAWRHKLYSDHPQLRGKRLILMPGRLTRWKGQEAFLEMMHILVRSNPECHGLIVGAAESNKQHYLNELTNKQKNLGLEHSVSFMGHREDIENFYKIASVTCHMSNKSEPFGRTVPEALASGCPVVAFDRGGASESLKFSFSEGLVAPDDINAFAHRVSHVLTMDSQAITLPKEFFLESQVSKTLDVYRELLSKKG